MTARYLSPAGWPLTVKVPLVVAVLMVGVAVVASNVALMRLSDTQEAHLRQLAGAYLDGISTAVLPHVIRKDVWETYDNLDRARSRYAGVRVRHTIVALPDGSVLAASDPRAFPVRTPVPPALDDRFRGGADLVIDAEEANAWAQRVLEADETPVGRIYAEIGIGDLMLERRHTLLVLVLSNAGLTLLLAAIGYAMVRRMVRPVSVLATYVERARAGRVELIPPSRLPQAGTEFGHLFRRFNAMARALNEREALARRLAEEERLAQLGKLASGMAHEVNNPLGGMMNAVDTLERHGGDPDTRRIALDLLRRGLVGIQNVVKATLVGYKGVANPMRLEPGDIDDLKFLVQHLVARRRLHLDWRNELVAAIAIDGSATRQAALNLILNACQAAPPGSRVVVAAGVEAGAFRFSVCDRGPGLPAPVRRLYAEAAADMPPPENLTGLGAWTAACLAARMGGRFAVRSGTEVGTSIAMTVPLAEQETGLDAVA